MTHNASNDNEGVGGTIRQVGFIDLRFMFQTRKESKVLNLERSLKEFISAGKAFNKEFISMCLLGDGPALCKPQYITGSQDQLAKLYRYLIGSNNNVSGRMKIFSSSTICQLKHQSSSFKQYLLNKRMHINNAQMVPEERIVMGWITGSNPAFTHRNGMRDGLVATMGDDVEGIELALYPKTIYYTRR
jgi:hypothetical protein